MAGLLYGAGLRLMECVRLRVKDVDFAYQQITVRDGKGAQDRVTMLPQSLQESLQRHLVKVQLLHEEDLQEGYGDVYLPYAFERKDPNAGKSWLWQYVFPAAKRSIDPRSGIERRHHVSEANLQRAVKHAIRQAGRLISWLASPRNLGNGCWMSPAAPASWPDCRPNRWASQVA
jgi:integrase